MELLRVQWEDDAYVSINSDHIMNNLQTSEETVSIRLITTDRKATQIGLDFGPVGQQQQRAVSGILDSGKRGINTAGAGG